MESFSIDESQSGTAASCAEVSGKLSPIALYDRKILLGKIDPAAVASQIALGIRSGVRALITACVAIVETERLLADDAVLRKAFHDALARENIIPRRSARLGDFDKSKLAMLRKVGENAALLLREELSGYLQPGYSVLYYIVWL